MADENPFADLITETNQPQNPFADLIPQQQEPRTLSEKVMSGLRLNTQGVDVSSKPDPGTSVAPTGTLKGEAQRVLGGIETAGQLLSGAVATPVAGLAGIAAAVIPGGRTGPEAVEDVSQALTFQPRTEAGKQISAAVSKPFEKFEEFADVAGEVTGDPDDVLGATAVKTLILAAPALLGIRGARGAKAQRSVASVSEKLQKQIPTVEELFKEGNKAFKRADDAGVTIVQESAVELAKNISAKVIKDGIDETLHPRSSAALKRIVSDTEGGISFQQLETLRKIAKDAAGSLERADRRFGRIMVNEIDDFIAQLDQTKVVGGNAQIAKTSITQARNFWSRARKGEQLEGLVDRAGIRAGQFTGSGFENALRTEFRSLALNPKRMRGFSKAEQAAIRRVAEGGPIANALRMVGKFAPRGVVSTAISVGGGAAIGGPLGAILLPVIGEAGRFGATAATKAAAQRASELARSGGQ